MLIMCSARSSLFSLEHVGNSDDVRVLTLTVGVGVEPRSALLTARALKLRFTPTLTRTIAALWQRADRAAATH